MRALVFFWVQFEFGFVSWAFSFSFIIFEKIASLSHNIDLAGLLAKASKGII
jgi:hypothetical protein